MADELQYESRIDLQKLPKLEVCGGDPILVLRPPVPRGWYLSLFIFGIAQFCALCAIVVFFIRVLSSFPSSIGGLPHDLKLLLIGQFAGVAFWMLEGICFATWSFRQYQMGLTPRRLWISNGAIHLSRAANWRVSTKTRDLQSVREIYLKLIKGFTGGAAGALLIVRFGRFRRWSFRFKQNQMLLANEARSRFSRCLEQSSQAKGRRSAC